MTSYLASYSAPQFSAGGSPPQFYQGNMWGFGIKANTWPIRVAVIETDFSAAYRNTIGYNILSGASLSLSGVAVSASFVPLRLNSPAVTATGGLCWWYENSSGTYTYGGTAPTGVTSSNFFAIPPTPWQPALAVTIPVGSALWVGSLTTYTNVNQTLTSGGTATYCRIYYEELRVQWSS